MVSVIKLQENSSTSASAKEAIKDDHFFKF